jgi:membrane-associated phospholipid phosphatase/MFS family permease
MSVLAEAGAAGAKSRSIHASARFLALFGAAALGAGVGRAIATTYLPVLLDRLDHSPGLIAVVMLVNPLAGFFVPLAVGIWSDRRAAGSFGRRLPFVVGGALIGAGGLGAVALGSGTSYFLLAAAGAAAYIGLNAATTGHRAIVAESFPDHERPAATSAQEVAMIVGGLLGIAVGGALISTSASLVFAVGAVGLPVLSAATVISVARGPGVNALPETQPADTVESRAWHRALLELLGKPGAREVLAAQVLWVAAYAALPVFFILYAADVLGLGAGTASLLLVGFGVMTAAGMLAAARARPERVYPLLVAGATMLGTGLLGAAAFQRPALVAAPFAVAALGFGLVTTLGFPYFARFIPAGEAGRYSGAYFAARAIASAVALPLAGGLIAATGSYRALLLMGAASLAALVPLVRARPRPAGVPASVARRPAPRRIAAVIPCYGCEPLAPVVAATLGHVDQVVLVDDGSSDAVSVDIERLADRHGARLVRLADNGGKGTAVAAGVQAALEAKDRPDALVVVDSDGQHPPDRIPAFIEAACRADLVIGSRADRRSMPWTRRFTNFASSALLGLATRCDVPDSQCGMRLYRADALERVPLPPGRYEAETVHLKQAIGAGLRVAWVPIPAIYNGSPSSFRPVTDTLRVLRAILAGPTAQRSRAGARPRLRVPSHAFARHWSARLGTLIAATVLLGAILPLFAPLDYRLTREVNSLGDGPEWLFRVFDPHTRNYILLSLLAVAAAALVKPRRLLGAAAAVLVAAFLSDLLVQAVYLLVDRPRPSEALGGEVLLSHGLTWAHIASFPSGHMVVTSAIVAVAIAIAPALRTPLWLYVCAVGLTRILFGAHFAFDVIVGVAFGYVVGQFAVALAQTTGLLPVGPRDAVEGQERPAAVQPAEQYS